MPAVKLTSQLVDDFLEQYGKICIEELQARQCVDNIDKSGLCSEDKNTYKQPIQQDWLQGIASVRLDMEGALSRAILDSDASYLKEWL